jgi:asparagine synthase (glutamine-hydrolysing)
VSAICGIFRFDRAPASRGEIGQLLEALRHFGDEPQSWALESADSPIALGSRLRRVAPEDAYYRPPLHSADDRLVLVADARIDNRAELGTALGISPREATQVSDAAFILAAYQAWESDAPRRLIGDFAFALWDQRHRRLFCARDGMGLRVLYYHLSAQRIAFATAPFALTALIDVPSRLN